MPERTYRASARDACPRAVRLPILPDRVWRMWCAPYYGYAGAGRWLKSGADVVYCGCRERRNPFSGARQPARRDPPPRSRRTADSEAIHCAPFGLTRPHLASTGQRRPASSRPPWSWTLARWRYAQSCALRTRTSHQWDDRWPANCAGRMERVNWFSWLSRSALA